MCRAPLLSTLQAAKEKNNTPAMSMSLCCNRIQVAMIKLIHHLVGQMVAGSNSRLKMSTSDGQPLLGDPTMLLSMANTISWKAPWNSSSSKSSCLHMRATSCAGLRNIGPRPKAPKTKLRCPQYEAIRSTARIFSLMSSFSCANEYLQPLSSSFGRRTGATEMTGREAMSVKGA